MRMLRPPDIVAYVHCFSDERDAMRSAGLREHCEKFSLKKVERSIVKFRQFNEIHTMFLSISLQYFQQTGAIFNRILQGIFPAFAGKGRGDLVPMSVIGFR
jgi:hypothetical protein